MSMIGNFLLVSHQELRRLQGSPETIHDLLASRVYDAASPIDYVDVDKAWHALHFLLTGGADEGEPPLDFIAAGGEPIGDEDVGYGPARALGVAELATLHRALAALPASALIARYDAKALEREAIYPGGWDTLDPSNADDVGYFTGAYDDVRALVAEGAAAGKCLLIWLN